MHTTLPHAPLPATQVHLATNMATGQQYACKTIPRDKLVEEDDKQGVRDEVCGGVANSSCGSAF